MTLRWSGEYFVATQVEERLVGAVLGPAGRYVEEIKQYRSQGYDKSHNVYSSSEDEEPQIFLEVFLLIL